MKGLEWPDFVAVSAKALVLLQCGNSLILPDFDGQEKSSLPRKNNASQRAFMLLCSDMRRRIYI